jgi:YidC/Oxa1 family membrane protein insertase
MIIVSSVVAGVHALAPVLTVPSAAVDSLLRPFELAISHVLVTAHAALAAGGLPAASGLTWAASIAVLVVVVRLALLPLTLRQVRSARRLAASGPALREVRDRYRGARDPEALARMRADTAAVYAQAGVGPLGCLPLLAQAPVLLALFRVLNGAAHGHPVGAMTSTRVPQLDAASLWGASFSDTMHTGGTAAVVAAALTAVMAGAVWLGQHRQLTRNTPPEVLDGAAGRSQRLAVWLAPLLVSLPGLTFPIGMLVYFACTNVWSLGQQLAVIRFLPTPGSPGHARRHGSPG